MKQIYQGDQGCSVIALVTSKQGGLLILNGIFHCPNDRRSWDLAVEILKFQSPRWFCSLLCSQQCCQVWNCKLLNTTLLSSTASNGHSVP